MKLIVLLGIFFVVSAINDLSGSKQGQIFDDEVMVELRSTRIGRSIMNLAELASYTKDFDFNKLFKAIDELDESLKQGKTDEDTLFQADYNQYTADVDLYNSFITMYTEAIADYKQQIKDYEGQLEYLQKNLDERKEQLSQTKNLKVQLEAVMAQNARIYADQIKDFESAINALDKATQLLTTLKNEDGSFLQIDKEQYHKAANEIEESFKQLKHQRFLYQPLTDGLVQLATEGVADQQLLMKVINFMTSVRRSLSDGRLTLTANYELLLKENQDLLQKHNNTISDLENIIIPQLLDDIDDTQEWIRVYNNMVKESEQNLEDARVDLKFTEERWAQRKVQHRELVDEYDKELLTLSQAVNALSKGGIKRK